MQISKKNQAIERRNSEICIATEYSIDDTLIDFAIVKISGRYPEAKRVTNKECKEIVYVHDGSGKVVIDDKEHLINAGDLILIEADEKYYREGNLHLFISCRPAWKKDQHQFVD